MKFLTSILGTDRDRLSRKRRSLEVNLHRLEEKTFLLEMELEETRRERQKVIDELRSMLPSRMVSTVSMASTDCSFNTESTTGTNDRYCGLQMSTSTPRIDNETNSSSKSGGKADIFRKEEEERVKWLKKQEEKEKKLSRSLEKY